MTQVPSGEGPRGQPRCSLHIGLNKTGTSMLQRRLFPHHPQVDYLGKWHEPGHFRDAATRALIEPLIEGRIDDTMRRRCGELFAQRVQPSLNVGKIAVWSLEGMCGGRAEARRQRAENFRDVFGPCHVLIVLRHPLSLVESLYFQKLKGAQRGKSPYFPPGSCFSVEAWLQRCWSNERHQGVMSVLDYARTVRIFGDVFGQEAVSVLLFEQLVAAPDRFVSDVCRSIGIDPEPGVRSTAGKRDNVRWGPEQIDRLTRIAHSPLTRTFFRLAPRRWRMRILGARAADRPGSGAKARALLSEEWQGRICDFTREGNRELVEHWGVPLDRYGYPL
jgi:hypothetical protein